MPEELPLPTKRSAGGRSGNSRNRRGGPRKTIPTYYDAAVSVEGEEGMGMCLSQPNGLLTHVTSTQGPARASDRPKRPAAELVLRQNARLHPLTRREMALRIARASEIIPGQEWRQAVLPRVLVHIAIPMPMQSPNSLFLRHGTCQTIWPTSNTCSQRTYRVRSRSAVWPLALAAESHWRGRWRGGSRSSGRANA